MRSIIVHLTLRCGKLHNKLDEYLKQIEVSAIAGFLANQWQASGTAVPGGRAWQILTLRTTS